MTICLGNIQYLISNAFVGPIIDKSVPLMKKRKYIK